jgi:hypothetical protein
MPTCIITSPLVTSELSHVNTFLKFYSCLSIIGDALFNVQFLQSYTTFDTCPCYVFAASFLCYIHA